MISDEDFLRSIPPPKLRFLVTAMLHKCPQSALKFPCKASEPLIDKVRHLCINWRALAHPARYKMDQAMLAVAAFLQRYPKYWPWKLPISPETSLSSLATTPPQSEQELSQPLNPTPTSSQRTLTTPQPVIVTPPKKLLAKKKSYTIIGLVPTPQARAGPIRVRSYRPKRPATKGRLDAAENAASPWNDSPSRRQKQSPDNVSTASQAGSNTLNATELVDTPTAVDQELLDDIVNELEASLLNLDYLESPQLPAQPEPSQPATLKHPFLPPDRNLAGEELLHDTAEPSNAAVHRLAPIFEPIVLPNDVTPPVLTPEHEAAFDDPDRNSHLEEGSTDEPMSESGGEGSGGTQTSPSDEDHKDAGPQDEASSDSSDEMLRYEHTADAVSNSVISDEELVAIHLTTASLSHPHDRLIGWGGPNLDDKVFDLETQPDPDGRLPVWVPIQRISAPGGYQDGLQSSGQDVMMLRYGIVLVAIAVLTGLQIAFLGLGHASSWFILPSQQTNAGLQRAPSPSVTKGKLHEGKRCRLPQYALAGVNILVLEGDEGPCITCLIVKAKPGALCQYDIGLTATTSSHLQRIVEDPPKWVISPCLVASLDGSHILDSQLLDPVYRTDHILEAWLCWIQGNKIESYCILVLPGYWTFLRGHFYVLMHHIGWGRSMMSETSDSSLRQYRLYMQFERKHLAKIKKLTPRKYFALDAVSQPERNQYYMSPAARFPRIEWEDGSSIYYPYPKSNKNRLHSALEHPLGSGLHQRRQNLETIAKNDGYSCDKLVGPECIHEMASYPKPFAGVPITMSDVGIGSVWCEVVPCCEEEIRGEELIGIDQSHFEVSHTYLFRCGCGLNMGYSQCTAGSPRWATSGISPSPTYHQLQPVKSRKAAQFFELAVGAPQRNRKASKPPRKVPSHPRVCCMTINCKLGGGKVGREGTEATPTLASRRGPTQEKGSGFSTFARMDDSERSAKVTEALRDSCYHEQHELQAIWDRPDKQALPLHDTLMLGKEMWDLLQNTHVGQLPTADLMSHDDLGPLIPSAEDHAIRITMDHWMSFLNAGRSWLTAMKYIVRHMHERDVDNVLRRLRIEHHFPKVEKVGKDGKKPQGPSASEVKSHLDGLFGELKTRWGLKPGDNESPLYYDEQTEDLEPLEELCKAAKTSASSQNITFMAAPQPALAAYILAHLMEILPEDSELGRQLSWNQLFQFFRLICRIAPATFDRSEEYLQGNELDFLATHGICPQTTITFDGTEWAIKLPPTCCDNRPLKADSVTEARLYALTHGVLLIFVKSYYCHKCKTHFNVNYQVQDAQRPEARRIYYDEMPEVLEVEETVFMEVRLIEAFRELMATLHTSASGIVQWYNQGIATVATNVPNNLKYHAVMTGEMVYDAFFLHALEERNIRMVGTGQEQWAHRCKICMHLIRGPDGKLYSLDAGTMDGITMGHTCCSIEGICKELLATLKDQFCPSHSDRNNKCFVMGCQEPPNKANHSLACAMPAHCKREVELRQRTQKGMKELIAEAEGSESTGPTVNPTEATTMPGRAVQMEALFGVLLHAPKALNTVVGRLNRKWMHNEQLFVHPCGVIVSRCTFYNAESLTDFLKVTFPTSKYPNCLPSYIFYDNNCQLLRHAWKQRDTYYNKTGMVVETWHAKSHKETDEFCRQWCLPSRFSELMTVGHNGKPKWRFNASSAEQANAWFGGYHPIVREMPRCCGSYNFYLDEMITMQNCAVVAKLDTRGQSPVLVPEHVLQEPVALVSDSMQHGASGASTMMKGLPTIKVALGLSVVGSLS
ncbi:hypothetical protein IW262DRAFT_1296832 [Armillaria fumosa]|nr:hypothetical protein IW262DRAFT_1296832 [Armillaria fumosa]